MHRHHEALICCLKETALITWAVEQEEFYSPRNTGPNVSDYVRNGALLCALVTHKFPCKLTAKTFSEISWEQKHAKASNILLLKQYLAHYIQTLESQRERQYQLKDWEVEIENLHINSDISHYYQLVRGLDRILCDPPHSSSCGTLQTRTGISDPIRDQRNFPVYAVHKDTFHGSPSRLRRPSIVSPLKRAHCGHESEKLSGKVALTRCSSAETDSLDGSSDHGNSMDAFQNLRQSKEDRFNSKPDGSKIPRFDSVKQSQPVKSPIRHSFVTTKDAKKKYGLMCGSNALSALRSRFGFSNQMKNIRGSSEVDDDDDTASSSSFGEEKPSRPNIGHKRPRAPIALDSQRKDEEKIRKEQAQSTLHVQDCPHESVAIHGDATHPDQVDNNSQTNGEDGEDRVSLTTSPQLEQDGPLAAAVYMDLRKDNARLRMKMEHLDSEINFMYHLLTDVEKTLQKWHDDRLAHHQNSPNDMDCQTNTTQALVERIEEIIRVPRKTPPF
uniref:AlNc14C150G7520 protein n=1 Tax=Albugo laibachii Nc14 TaxID=890382 RepID=F0WM07_9STRA|nr:AlNc14C150G7520 [Albugo laibachii Nc14]|eukprot:CCA22334.1 AlNc14C150G7520 [Albugo laibachii Nc14]